MTTKNLETILDGMFGAPGSAFADESAVCVRALQPAVDMLLQQGHPARVICAGMALLAVAARNDERPDAQ